MQIFRITSLHLLRRTVVRPSMRTHAYLSSQTKKSKNIVVVDGVRIPFAMASTTYADQMAVDLQRLAFKGLIEKAGIERENIDYIISGQVIQEVKTSNIAREAALNCGFPNSIGGHTVAMACISSNSAICSAAEKILSGRASAVIAGGCETFSDVPIRLTRPLRQKLITIPKVLKKGGPIGGLKHLLSLNFKSIFSLETPAIANYTTGEVMGFSSDKMAAMFGVSRQEQDEFAVRSHTNAAKAHEEGFYDEEIIPYKGSTKENGVKSDSKLEKISKMKPAFIKPHGTHTAANSSFLSDGASASLLMNEERALELGFKPMAYLRDWSFKACDPFQELLLGPTYTSQEVLGRNGLNMETDIGVFEIHEAFAGQVLSNFTAMNSQTFADKNFGGKKVGKVDINKVNTKGGSLAIGHPFGATGSRLVTTASRRLQKEQERFALVAACADGGCGHACILERYDN